MGAFAMIVQNGVCVIVQARLGSKRLPKKAILNLDDKNLLEHVLRSLTSVDAQLYILACDYASEKAFYPIAEKYNFFLVTGSEHDVLSRFGVAVKRAEAICSQQNISPITCVVRATGDNPFLFTEAISDSIKAFFELQCPDYFTFTGLPHGSGVELFHPKALLAAAQNANLNEYEREHVGPALYYHRDIYRVVYQVSPKEYYFPDMRTTVDTEEDLIRTKDALAFLHEKKIKLPATVSQIVTAIRYSVNSIVFVPLIEKGKGSGHLRRAIELAETLHLTVRTFIFVPDQDLPDFAKRLLDSVSPELIITELPKRTRLIVLDYFQSDCDFVKMLQNIAPVLAIDEGGPARKIVDYVFDIIPRLTTENEVSPNKTDISCIPLPVNRKAQRLPFQAHTNTSEKIKLLVSCGGEDKENMAIQIGLTLSELPFDVTVISPETSFSLIQEMRGRLSLQHTVPHLREQLFRYDIVVTIFGFTAFEALAAGCYVLLVSPTEYHYQLGQGLGFSTFPPGIPTKEDFQHVFNRGVQCPNTINPQTQQTDLAQEILKMSSSMHYACPICDADDEHNIVFRFQDRTISQCNRTGLYHVSFIISPEKTYNENYFFEEYKAQYGKTYLEDFENIMEQGKRRLSIIEDCFSKYLDTGASQFEQEKNLLDIGCAYGAFLKVCERSDWFAVGTDISSEAISYVTGQLHLPAFVARFPLLPEQFVYHRKNQLTGVENEQVVFHLQKGAFQAITMWFVIEHFQHLDAVLRQVSALLVDGGIFAFSTPTLSGISGKQNAAQFFQKSPSDHYSIFDFESVTKVLDLYGFKIIKTISVGHHPERFKRFSKVKKGSLAYKLLFRLSQHFHLGDTMEIYAIKRVQV